jgi:acylglycerol lipase
VNELKKMYLTINQNNIFYRTWAIDNAKAALVIAHGVGEHSGRYQHLAEYFNRIGYSVYALDHRGHGGSDGKQGHIESFAAYGDDLHSFITFVKQQGFDNRVHLIGHSMGGLIATAYGIRYADVQSIILSAPGYRAKRNVGKLKLSLVKILEKVAPALTVPNELNTSGISRSQSVIERYLNDPLVHGRISLRWFLSFLKESEFVSNNLDRFNLPCLLLLAESDLLVDSTVSEQYFNGFASDKKVICRYPESYHEIFNEVEESQLAFAEVFKWIESF